MKKQAYQKPTIYNSDGTKAQTGTYDIRADPLTNSAADGILDYINNNLEALNDRADNSNTADETLQTNIDAEAAERKKADETLQANIDAEAAERKKADENLSNTSVSTTTLTVTGETSVPTANIGNSSKAIANTEYVRGELTNYLPLRGGTVTGGLTVEGTITGNLAGNATNATNATNDGNGNNIASTYIPAVVGAVVAFAGSTTPQGWLLCDGSAVSRTDYAALYAVIGTTYGAGNGSSTFNVPNLVDKFVEGSATAGTVKSAGLPNITGSMFSFVTGGANLNQGALYQTTQPPVTTTTGNSSGSAYNWRWINLDASRSNSIYGNSSTVQPPALTMRYIIKY